MHNIKNNIKKLKNKLSLTVKKKRLINDSIIHVCVKDIKRKGSNFEIDKCPQYLSAKMMVKSPNISIKDTPYYNYVRQIDYYLFCHPAPLVPWKQEEQCQKFVELFNSINEQGYRPDKYGFIEILISNNGEIKLYEGHHRLAILKAINPGQFIAVKVKERSHDWLNFKKFIFKTCQKKMEAYHPIFHPDFDNWTFHYNEDDRFNAVLACIGDPKGKTVLDIGVQLGYFSFKLAQLGAEVTGIDNQKRWVEACERFNPIYGLKVNFHHNDFVNILCHYQDRKWDYCIFLNVLHWFMAQRKGGMTAVERMMLLLSKKIDNLFFSTGTLEEACIFSGPLTEVLENRKISDWICNISQYKHSKYLLKDKQGRELFLFSK